MYIYTFTISLQPRPWIDGNTRRRLVLSICQGWVASNTLRFCCFTESRAVATTLHAQVKHVCCLIHPKVLRFQQILYSFINATRELTGDICVFPKIGVTPNHPLKNRVFHYKPSIFRYPYFWKHPFGGGIMVYPTSFSRHISHPIDPFSDRVEPLKLVTYWKVWLRSLPIVPCLNL